MRCLRSTVVLLIVSGVSAGAEGGFSYAGTKKCKPCHLKEYNAWSETKMAKAFDLLKPGAAAAAKTKAKLDPNKDYTKDPTCLACHTTGYGKPGGFVDMESTPDMAGVGCEMCHGPGGTYLKTEYMSLQNKEFKRAALVAVGLVGAISKDQCTPCHNAKSPFFMEFKFEERTTKGTHEKFPLRFPH